MTATFPKSADCCGGTLLREALRREFDATLIHPQWPAPAGVRAAVTTRLGPEPTQCSAYGFNVGTRCGDAPAAVLRNREFLRDALALPSEPAWLRQVHGTRVAVLDCPHPNPPPQAGEGGGPAAVVGRIQPPQAGEGAGLAAAFGRIRPSQAGEGAGRSGSVHALLPPRAGEGAGLAAFPGISLPPLAGEGAGLAAFPRISLPPRAGEGARRADGGDAAGEPEADAVVTHTRGTVLAIQTADCLPVLFCAADGSAVAAAHAGWRGLSAGVLEATVSMLKVPRDSILAWLGPAIAAESYEVGAEVRDAFLAHAAGAAAAFTATRPGHWRCDLYVLARQRLQAAGVTRIFGGGLDTFTDARLHSYRRDGVASGRMVSLVWMLPAAV